jgi:hypothetical protein
VVLAAVLITGCATAPTYQATVVDRSDGAIVRGWKSSGFIFLQDF